MILGKSRGIRSDEWAVLTPMTLSQLENATGSFPYFGETLRGSLTDMFIIYGQPVSDWMMIFRPFQVGYLFLTAGQGMAFFWCGRTIALFLVSFEMGMLITDKNRRLSVIYAFLIMWAPAVQWWFAINGFVEMLIFSQLSVLLLNLYMRKPDVRIRLACLVGIFICAGGYILTFYPAWQIPLLFVLIGLLLWVFLKNYRQCEMQKRDWAMIIIAVILFAVVMGSILYRSRETLAAVLNTAYPGKRIGLGGKQGKRISQYIVNIWSAMFGESGFTKNAVEDSHFFWFYPICYILPVYVWVKEKKKDILLNILTGISVFLWIYCVIGFPKIIAVATMMKFTTGKRALVILEFAGVLLLIRSVSLIKNSVDKKIAVTISMLATGLLMYSCFRENPAFFNKSIFVVTFTVVFVIFVGILLYQKEKISKFFVIGILTVMFFCGGLVNPVRHGIGNLEEIKILEEIDQIQERDPKALWAVEDESIPYINVPIIKGAATINSTNTYPDIKKWQKIDPEKKYTKIYNRYAHIELEVKKEGEPEFELVTDDRVKIRLTLNSLALLDVKYIWSKNDLHMMCTNEYGVETLYEDQNGDRIYQIHSLKSN